MLRKDQLTGEKHRSGLTPIKTLINADGVDQRRYPRISASNSKRGAVLITVIIILAFLAVLGMSLVAFLFSRSVHNQMELDRLKALYLAEAGIAASLYELRVDIDYDGDGVGNIPERKLGDGTYRVRHGFQTSTITSTGIVNDARRTVQIRYSAL